MPVHVKINAAPYFVPFAQPCPNMAGKKVPTWLFLCCNFAPEVKLLRNEHKGKKVRGVRAAA